MAESNLNSLDPMAFASLIPTREEHIAKAEPVRGKHYAPNILAEALHPAYQDLVVTEVRENTKNAKTYTLESADKKGVAYFEAGQYLSFDLDIGGIRTTRAYTIASSPGEALEGRYRITVKRVDGGLASGYILDNWSVGTAVRASAPVGSFTYEPLRDARHVIAAAGGSGITPFLSLAGAVADKTEDLFLTILYGARREDEILHREELDKKCEICHNVNIVYVLSEEKKEGFEHGFITAELISRYSKGEPYSLFLCGPEGMYKYLEGELSALSLERKYIRREVQSESYDPESLEGYPGTDKDIISIKVKQGSLERTVKGSKRDTVLRILEKGGIRPPSHCRGGECGFCRSKLLSGETFIPAETDRRRLADEPYGYIHPCCTYPISDLEIEIAL